MCAEKRRISTNTSSFWQAKMGGKVKPCQTTGFFQSISAPLSSSPQSTACPMGSSAFWLRFSRWLMSSYCGTRVDTTAYTHINLGNSKTVAITTHHRNGWGPTVSFSPWISLSPWFNTVGNVMTLCNERGWATGLKAINLNQMQNSLACLRWNVIFQRRYHHITLRGCHTSWYEGLHQAPNYCPSPARPTELGLFLSEPHAHSVKLHSKPMMKF